MVVLGLDTDAKGSIAVLDLSQLSRPTLDVYPIPHHYNTLKKGTKRISVTFHALAALMTDLTSFAHVAWLEEQWSRPGQDSGAMFGFGTTYGDIRTATAAGFLTNGTPLIEIPTKIQFVHSTIWKGVLRLDDDKKKALALADGLFPECKHAWKLVSKHTSAAEASLIAFYGASQMGIRFQKGVAIRPREKPCSTVVKSLLV